MATNRASQLAVITVAAQPASIPRLSQLAVITLTGQPSRPVRASQLAVIAVAMNNKKFVSLGDPIGLECWQPCTAFGTTSTIFYLG